MNTRGVVVSSSSSSRPLNKTVTKGRQALGCPASIPDTGRRFAMKATRSLGTLGV